MWIGNQKQGALTRDDLLELGRLLLKAGYAVRPSRVNKGRSTRPSYAHGLRAAGDRQAEKPGFLALEDIQRKYGLDYGQLVQLIQEVGALTECQPEAELIIRKLDEIDSEES